MSFLEMLDVVNEALIVKGEDPIAFDSDCREGICGTCGFLVSGIPHGPDPGTTVCQLHMRRFKDGDTLTLEPWRAKAFPVIKDLVVDRSAFDRIIQSPAAIRRSTSAARRTPTRILIPKPVVDLAMDSAACIALRRVRRRLQECIGGAIHVGEDQSPGAAAAGRSRTTHAASCGWSSGTMPRVRQLLQRRRVRGGLPEGNSDHQHRPYEPGVSQGDAGDPSMKRAQTTE